MYQREAEKKLRVGIVGAGSHMYRNLLPALHYLPVELVAICNRGQEKLERTLAEYRCAGYRTPAQMYENEKLDAVIMAVSPQMHPALACEAMEHGLHVFMEKPASVDLAGIRQMKQVSEKTGKYVMVGYKKAFMPATRKVEDLLKSGLGESLSSILAVYPLTIPADGKMIAENGKPTNWLANACHPLSVMLQVGGPVKSVQALTNDRGYGVVFLKYESGVAGTLHLSEGPRPNRDEYKFYGAGWSVEVECSHRVTCRRGIPFVYDYTDNFAPAGTDSGDLVWEPWSCQATLENKALFVQGMVQQMACFCECVLEGKAPERGSLDFAEHLTKVYEAALVSRGAEILIS